MKWKRSTPSSSRRPWTNLEKKELVDIFVCPVCGYTVEGEAPDKCPVCNAVKKLFKRSVKSDPQRNFQGGGPGGLPHPQ